MSAREAILQRLRIAHDAATSIPLPAPYALAHDEHDPAQRFAERAHVAGMTVTAVEAQDLAGALVRAAVGAGASTVAMWDDPVLAPARTALVGVGIGVLAPADQTKAHLAAAQVGITTATYAVAETATLVLDCGPQRPRSTSLLPPLHVVVLLRSGILPTLSDLLRRLPSLSSAVTLISGPSRSADIELTPVRGVHGPTAVAVYVIPERSG